MTKEQIIDLQCFMKNGCMTVMARKTDYEFARDVYADTACAIGCNYIGRTAFYSYVKYISKQFTYWPLNVLNVKQHRIYFSDNFSGCALALFKKENTLYIAHISIESGSPWNTLDAWNNFSTYAKFEYIKCFFPFSPFIQEIVEALIRTQEDIYRFNCIGIMDKKQQCYSAIYDTKKQRIIKVVEWDDLDNDLIYKPKSGHVIYSCPLP